MVPFKEKSIQVWYSKAQSSRPQELQIGKSIRCSCRGELLSGCRVSGDHGSGSGHFRAPGSDSGFGFRGSGFRDVGFRVPGFRVRFRFVRHRLEGAGLSEARLKHLDPSSTSAETSTLNPEFFCNEMRERTGIPGILLSTVQAAGYSQRPGYRGLQGFSASYYNINNLRVCGFGFRV